MERGFKRSGLPPRCSPFGLRPPTHTTLRASNPCDTKQLVSHLSFPWKLKTPLRRWIVYCKNMGKTHSAINKMLNGGSTITMENLEKIATLTKRPINYFFDNSTDVKGNQNIVGKNITVSPDVEKDIALMRVKIEALESKIENLELKYNLLKKGK